MDRSTWWNSLKHGGMLIAPSRLAEKDENQQPWFPDDFDRLPDTLTERLRRDITRLEAGEANALSDILTTALDGVCGLREGDGAIWSRGADVDTRWSRRLLTGEMQRPRRLWQGPYGAVLPVFTDDERRLGVGRGRRAVSRVLEWLRIANQKVALLTNGRQWRLLYAGTDHEAWVEWDTENWFEEGQPGPQLTALRALLSPGVLTPKAAGEDAPLIRAILDSRKGESEVTALLGERVRTAVETLIAGHQATLSQVQESPRDIYRAAVRVIMRLVVVLFAEARDLLPREHPIYHQSYGLDSLREELDRFRGSAADRLKHRYIAWPRILSLFRLIFDGSPHEGLPILRYGGGLFKPGDATSDDAVLRALMAFESVEQAPSDDVVRRILDLISRTRVKMRQGRGATWVEAPVDFSDLSSEYIGILYEGLLDFELRCADGPVIFLNLGDEPALPLERLEGMDDRALASLVSKLKVSDRVAGEEDAEEDAGEEDADVSEEETTDEADTATEDVTEPSAEGDEHHMVRQRALDWAKRTVIAGRLVARPRGRRGADELEQALQTAAAGLVKRVVLPGEWYLVRWGGTRKGAGTFYTRPQLAVPTVVRTLCPLACDPPAGEADGPVPPAQWLPKEPEQIIALKVCDPAMGSGSFLVSALRYLTDTLYASLVAHGWLRDDGTEYRVSLDTALRPTWFAEIAKDFPIDYEKAEEKIRARLKRVIVERCLYGVDIDPLAVELGRLALWVETMDRELPFEFLDHKLKCGNSLVGCWFDQFREYPVLAWSREGADKEETNCIKQVQKAVRTPLIEALHRQLVLFTEMDDQQAQSIVATMSVAYVGGQEVSIYHPEQREEWFTAPTFRELHDKLTHLFDAWCAIWFWPADDLANAPMPTSLANLSPEMMVRVQALRARHRFFHWELEYPDVFRERGGFDAIVGNPPWETLQPESKEFFSNIDPLYRTYGKQEALAKQAEYFSTHPELEREWLEYNASFKALNNFIANSAAPWGDPEGNGESFSLARGKDNGYLHGQWRRKRAQWVSYADAQHPYRYQGDGKSYTYKMFVELGHALLRCDGTMGFIVPSGIYTDKGSVDLRALFLNGCRWEWLFGFENRDKIFAIDSRFKFCPIIVCKGGHTEAINAAFMRRNLVDWDNAERYVIAYPCAQVERFSPKTKAVLEIGSPRDLAVLTKIYEQSVLLGDGGPDGWGMKYAQGDFNMTSDSALFPPREKWEAQGYNSDEYGRWLRQDGDVALPLYQGLMIWQFDYCASAYMSGANRSARWEPLQWHEKHFRTQFLLSQQDYQTATSAVHGLKLGFRDISNATNERTMISSLIPDMPCGNVIGLLRSHESNHWTNLAILNSLPFDWTVRQRIGGTHLNWFIVQELPLLPREVVNATVEIAKYVAALGMPANVFSPDWLRLRYIVPALTSSSWKSLWAITPYERLRLRCMLDSIIAELFGLTWDDFAWILRDCDHPVDDIRNKAFARALDPKGFWRVDKEKAPELRHTVLTLLAFRDLKDTIAAHGGDRDQGIAAFCAANGGDGWMLPETFRLADLGLGHDARAEEPQPVASVLGPRFLDWQLAQTQEESWAECERHARNLLGEAGFRHLLAELNAADDAEPVSAGTIEAGETDLFGAPIQRDLFGNPVETKRQPKKVPQQPVDPGIVYQPVFAQGSTLPYSENPQRFPWRRGREEFVYDVIPLLSATREGQSYEFYLHAAILATRPERLRALLPVDTQAQFDGYPEATRMSCTFPEDHHLRPRQIRRRLGQNGFTNVINADSDIVRLASNHPPLRSLDQRQEQLLTFALEAADELHKMMHDTGAASPDRKARVELTLEDFNRLYVNV